MEFDLPAMLLMAGAIKVMQPKEKLQEPMGRGGDFDGTHVKGIGALEVVRRSG
jgi:hypothetical protein